MTSHHEVASRLCGEISVRWRGELVAWFSGNELLLHGPWQSFDGAIASMNQIARGLSFQEGSTKGLEFRRELSEFVILISGVERKRMPLEKLPAFIRATYQACRKAESKNHLVMEQQAYGNGMLARGGLGFGLSADPRVKDEARKIAATDPTLRKARPVGVVAKPIPDPPSVSRISPLETVKKLHEQQEQAKRELYGTN